MTTRQFFGIFVFNAITLNLFSEKFTLIAMKNCTELSNVASNYESFASNQRKSKHNEILASQTNNPSPPPLSRSSPSFPSPHFVGKWPQKLNKVNCVSSEEKRNVGWCHRRVNISTNEVTIHAWKNDLQLNTPTAHNIPCVAAVYRYLQWLSN